MAQRDSPQLRVVPSAPGVDVIPSEASLPFSESVAVALRNSVAELAEHKARLEHLSGWFEVALSNMARGLSIFDAAQRLIVCNKSYREMYSLPDELAQPGTQLSDIVRFHFERETGRNAPDDLEGQSAWIAKHVAEMARGRAFSHIQRLRDGRTILVSNQPLPGGGWVDLQEDISQQRQAEQRLKRLARYDPLSDLPNRAYFRELLEAALSRQDTCTGIALHWLDLDGFRRINDAYGQSVGDLLLKSVSDRLRAAVSQSDVVGRVGGDEFAIIQTDVDNLHNACRFAQSTVDLIGQTFHILGERVDISVSIGIALAPEHACQADGLLKNADLALSQVKSQRGGTWAIYNSAYGKQFEARQQIEADLRAAVEKEQLELHYQPVIDMKARRVTSFEALMRWRHPKRGLIAPCDFIPLAEETGLIVGLGAWALRKACRDASGWPDDIKVAVNLSSLQFQRGDLYQIVDDALTRSRLSPHRLELELTETVLLREDEKTLQVLRRLCDLGVRFSLDDFGTAFASLSYLRSFPVHKIKIDRTFVRELPQSKDCGAIIEAIASLAGRLHLSTVAEGVETREQLEAVTGAGCNEIQGFYFGRPVRSTGVERALTSCRAKLAAAE